ncbi:MAG: UbiD family decarboxylase domain-containing protein, partial [Planctomycetota bacterium]
LDKHVHADKGGKALLFENVKDGDIPVAINAVGSYWRIEKALGTPTLEDLAARVGKFVKPELPGTLMEKLKMGKEVFGDLMALRPKKRKTGPCQDVVYTGDAVDLNMLPIIQCWPHDGDLDSGEVFSTRASEIPEAKQRPRTGKYITLAGIYTTNPENGDKNIGMYRVQLLGKDRVAMHWHMHHDGA